MEMEEVQKIKEKYKSQLLERKGVVGVGIGKKKVKGVETDQLAIIVTVVQKIDKESLNKGDIVPKKLEGVPIDVQEVGKLKIQKKEE